MSSLISWKSAISASGLLLSGIAIKLMQNFGKQCDSALNEILFYGNEDEEQTIQAGLNNLFCINFVIGHATQTIDVCVPSLVSDTITKSLINVKQKGVKIRVAIHKSEDIESLQMFSEHGIEVKVINSEQLDHEFLLIDATNECQDAVAVIGSLDYDTSRVNCNRDTTMLISEQIVVISLKREFERIWESFCNKDSAEN